MPVTGTWNDLCSGLALLYLGPDGAPDEYTDRLMLAMEVQNVEEMEHVSALLIVKLNVRGELERWMAEEWERLTKEKAK